MDIYQQIWDADQAANGVPAIRVDEVNLRDDERGYVIVDEVDGAGRDHHILREVRIPSAKRASYALVRALFDNYTLDPLVPDRFTPREREEERRLVEAALDAPPMRVARQRLDDERSRPLSDQEFAELVDVTWFREGRTEGKFASGFEHVFIGEGAGGSSRTLDGYHFWYKYWLDDLGVTSGKDDIDHIRLRYEGSEDPAGGPMVPEVVTLSFTWNAFDHDRRRYYRKLEKPIGGFWVGCSAEGLLALGLVRAHSRAGKKAMILDTRYSLELYSLESEPRSIRTFYPVYLERVDPGCATGLDPGPQRPVLRGAGNQGR
jgi:hypothetical protein